MLYPIKFLPIYKNIIWGGKNICSHFNRTVTLDQVAESWELSCRSDGMSIVTNGQFKERSLRSLIDEFGSDLLGTRSIEKFNGTFPLLIKILDAVDKLSVQVHPADNNVRIKAECSGKNEMWYILDAKKDARLVCGLKPNITKQRFVDAVSQNRILETLNEISIKPGDSIFIPAGMVHAILDGILMVEIQQNNNTTYRIYDWDRLDSQGHSRELHIEKALEVINFNQIPVLNPETGIADNIGYTKKELLRTEFFNIDEISVKKVYEGHMDGSTFIAAIILEGEGYLHYSAGKIEITTGETILIPAIIGKFEFVGSMKILLAEA